jgi:hypothetical protein
MGAFVPALAAAAPAAGATAAGATAAAAAPTFLGMTAAGWAAAGTAMTGLTAIRAGQAEKVAMDVAADQEKQAAISREVARKRRLVSAIATQTAVRGAMGTTLTGSPASMILSDIRAAEYDRTIAAGTTASRVSSLQQEGKFAQQAGYASAGASLLDFGSRMAARG